MQSTERPHNSQRLGRLPMAPGVGSVDMANDDVMAALAVAAMDGGVMAPEAADLLRRCERGELTKSEFLAEVRQVAKHHAETDPPPAVAG